MALRQCGVPASFTSASQEDDKYPGQSVWAAVTPRRTGAKEKNGWGVELRLLYVTPEKLKASDAVWAKLKALERENRELRQTNEILRKASAYFAPLSANEDIRLPGNGTELDRRHKP